MTRVLLTLLLLGAALYLLTSVTVVNSGERAIVRRFGRLLPEKLNAGLHLHLPWGIDRVDRTAVDTARTLTVGYVPRDEDERSVPVGQFATGDHNLVNILVVVEYSILPDEVERFVLNAPVAESLLSRTIEAALAEWVAARKVDEVLLHGKTALGPHLLEETRVRLDQYHLGIEVRKAQVRDLSPPREVQANFDEVTRADTEIRTQIESAEQYKNTELSRASSRADDWRRQAAAYHIEQQLQAEAEAANFGKRLTQYRQLRGSNPQYIAGIWWNEMSRLYTSMRANGRIDVLDRHLGVDGLDLTQLQPLPKKK